MGSRLTAEYLRSRVIYDPATGIFTWLPLEGDTLAVKQWNAQRAGKRAGFVDGRYRCIKVGRTKYGEHVLAWLYVTGEWPPEIDHENLDGHKNEWRNLRVATRSQNEANKGLSARNTSGVKGVSFDHKRQCWETAISVNGKKKRLGRFRDLEIAAAAYANAAMEIFGKFARPARKTPAVMARVS